MIAAKSCLSRLVGWLAAYDVGFASLVCVMDGVGAMDGVTRSKRRNGMDTKSTDRRLLLFCEKVVGSEKSRLVL